MYDFQKALKAALFFAGKNDIRWYLNGVYCKNNTLQATDGHRLIVIKANVPAWAEDKIIDRASVIQITRVNNKVIRESGFFVDDDLIDFAQRYGIYPRFLQGKFPDTSKAIPRNESLSKDCNKKINAFYYFDAIKALIALDDPHLIDKKNPKEITFHRYGKEGVAYFCTGKVEIVIMSMRI